MFLMQFLDNNSEWKLGGTWKKTLSREIKKMSTAGKLVPGKTSGKYKLSDEFKKRPAVVLLSACASCHHNAGS